MSDNNKDYRENYAMAWPILIIGTGILIFIGAYGGAALISFIGFSLLYYVGKNKFDYEPQKGILIASGVMTLMSIFFFFSNL